MPFYERPNLKQAMYNAQADETSILSSKGDKGALTDSDKRILQKAAWDRRIAEANYYSQAGLGPAPWQNKISRWAIAVFAIGLIIIVVSASA